MKNLGKEEIKKDFEVISQLVQKYSDVIHEPQEGQRGHYLNQLEMVKQTITSIRVGLVVAHEGIMRLKKMANDGCIIEDEKQ